MKFIGIVLVVFALMGCSTGFQLQSPITKVAGENTPNEYMGLDAVKQVVDAICPKQRVPDPKGDFLSGFLDRFNKNRANVELSPQQVEDYKYLVKVCKVDPDLRTDYMYGWLAGGTADQVYQRLQPFFGKDLYNIASLLGVVIK